MRCENSRWYSKVFAVILGLIVLLLALVALAPTIVSSTSWGKEWLISTINPSFKLSIESLELSWFGKQELSGIYVSDERMTFTADKVSSDTPLWEILLKKKGDLKVEQGKFKLDAISAENVNLNFEASSGKIHATGVTTQGGASGNFTVDGSITDLNTMQLQAKIVNFPVAILDTFSSTKLSPLIGTALNADLQVHSAPQVFEATLDANSPQFTAHAQTKMDSSFVTLQEPATMTLKTPDATVSVKVDDLRMPLADKEAFSFHSTIDVIGAESMNFLLSSDNYKTGVFNLSFKLPQIALENLKLIVRGNDIRVQKQDDLWNIDFDFTYKNGDLALAKPGKAVFTLTPELLPQGPFVLTKPTPVNLQLSQLDLKSRTFEGDLTIGTLSFTEKTTGQATEMNSLTLHIAQKETLSFNLNARVNPQGSLSLKGNSSAFNLEVQQFPTSVLDLFAKGFAKTNIAFAPYLGPTVNATASTALQNGVGPLKVDINSPTCKANLNGTLTNGVLTLQDSLYAQIAVTPELGQALIGTPTLRSPTPLSIEIPPRGVSIPISPLIKNQIQVPSARIELGQLTCKNEGNLNVTMGLLKLSQFGKSNSLKLWFAPIDLHIHNGIAECERTEILVADAYQVCIFGNIDLPKNWVDMTLGLTASCLRKAFGIKNLPENYLIQIPVTGPLNNVQIDSGKATGKITALLLWQQKSLAGSVVGGNAGALLGEVLSKLGPLPDEGSKAPPPKHPFPWEKMSSKAEEQQPVKKKKKHFKTDDKPLKQLLQFLK